MERILETFRNLKKKRKRAFIAFVMAGDPTIEDSLEMLLNLPKIGTDLIEIGVPFTDPIADGPSIQAAGLRALEQGITLNIVLDMVQKFRETNITTPIILMGYYNPIYSMGVQHFLEKATRCGVDGLIVVDLPPEEDDEFYFDAEKNNLSMIRLVTPTTDEKRLKKILLNATGFIYYVSITGITGTQAPDIKSVQGNIKKIKQVTDLPVVIGFGIRSSAQASMISDTCDGIVIGSAVVDLIKKTLDDDGNSSDKGLVSCLDFTRQISKVLKHN